MAEGGPGAADAADVVVALDEGRLAVFDDGGGVGVVKRGDLSWCHGGATRHQAFLATVRRQR
jgi:hypothetical protein